MPGRATGSAASRWRGRARPGRPSPRTRRVLRRGRGQGGLSRLQGMPWRGGRLAQCASGRPGGPRDWSFCGSVQRGHTRESNIQYIHSARCRRGAPRALAPRPGRSGRGCHGRARAAPHGGEGGARRGASGGGWRPGAQALHAVPAAACLSRAGKEVLAGPAGCGRPPPVPPRAGLRAPWTAGCGRRALASAGWSAGRGASGGVPRAAGVAGPCRRWEAREAGGGRWSSSGMGLCCARVCSPRRCLGGARGCVFGALTGGAEKRGVSEGWRCPRHPLVGGAGARCSVSVLGEQSPLAGGAGSR